MLCMYYILHILIPYTSIGACIIYVWIILYTYIAYYKRYTIVSAYYPNV